ncbi:MAG TPA: hypothetical protein VFR58_11855, partial [Flavisolibacter sp.]|nr:hypothetical protein [Flavisolibacter sp.]
DINEGRSGSSRPDDLSSDLNRINDEDNLDTREISNDIEEGDEDYDDEELDDEDLDDEDFELDDEDEDVDEDKDRM